MEHRPLLDWQLAEKQSLSNAAAIKGWLKQLGWTQAEFARRIGVDENTVSKWMTGKANPSEPALAYLRLAVRVKELM